jgi:hypothetical protein
MSAMKFREKSATEAVRDLYLDLLIKSISNLIYGALPPLPSSLSARAGRRKRDRVVAVTRAKRDLQPSQYPAP